MDASPAKRRWKVLGKLRPLVDASRRREKQHSIELPRVTALLEPETNSEIISGLIWEPNINQTCFGKFSIFYLLKSASLNRGYFQFNCISLPCKENWNKQHHFHFTQGTIEAQSFNKDMMARHLTQLGHW